MSEKIVTLNEEVIKGEIREHVRGSVEETLTYYAFPSEHWLKIRTNNMPERLNRESENERGWLELSRMENRR